MFKFDSSFIDFAPSPAEIRDSFHQISQEWYFSLLTPLDSNPLISTFRDEFRSDLIHCVVNLQIRFILLQNRQGKTRLAKYYVPLEDSEKHKVEYEVISASVLLSLLVHFTRLENFLVF